MKIKTKTFPVLFLIFNRPDTERKVFEIIKKVKPKHLFVAADGPRRNRKDDIERCIEARKIIDEGINWDCKVHKLYRKENLGCKIAVSSAIDWFFENVEEGIILEDDCLPDTSFFEYCSVLLKKYRDNSKIMHIGSNNFQDKNTRGTESYYFSKYPLIWGWATWRRAWKMYDISLSSNSTETGSIRKIQYLNLLDRLYWNSLFWCVKNNLINTWDYQWVYSIWSNCGICITPNANLVINIGIGNESTHTKRTNKMIDRMKLEQIKKIIHPKRISINSEADQHTLQNTFGVSPRNLWKVLSIIPYNIYKNLLK